MKHISLQSDIDPLNSVSAQTISSAVDGGPYGLFYSISRRQPRLPGVRLKFD